jgi:hypothetical protein
MAQAPRLSGARVDAGMWTRQPAMLPRLLPGLKTFMSVRCADSRVRPSLALGHQSDLILGTSWIQLACRVVVLGQSRKLPMFLRVRSDPPGGWRPVPRRVELVWAEADTPARAMETNRTAPARVMFMA